jgi:actin-like ATPase involved in cell morphogenesis
MLKETKYVNFIVGEKYDEYIRYRILAIIPSKVQELEIVNNEVITNYVDNYRISYKLIIDKLESPVSEVKTLTKFKPEIMEEIIAKAGIDLPCKVDVRVAEVTYV